MEEVAGPVVSEVLVIGATVILGFILNQGAKWLGLKPSENVKKGVVFVTATVLSGYALLQSGVDLPDPVANPIGFALALTSVATLNFKIAQPDYDRLWKGLLAA